MSTASTQQEPRCAKCGGTRLVQARLEEGMHFYMDQESGHGLHRLAMRAYLCPDCGYTEFWVRNPAQILMIGEEEHPLQEEDF